MYGENLIMAFTDRIFTMALTQRAFNMDFKERLYFCIYKENLYYRRDVLRVFKPVCLCQECQVSKKTTPDIDIFLVGDLPYFFKRNCHVRGVSNKLNFFKKILKAA